MQAAETFLDLTAGNLHTQRLWNSVDQLDAAALETEAARITAVFLAAYGSDALSRSARENDRP